MLSFFSPEVRSFLVDNQIDVQDLINKTRQPVEMRLGQNPATDSAGKKEPATILFATAGVIAAVTPLLRDVLRSLSGREAVVRERRLVPVKDSKGNVIRDLNGDATLYWVDVAKDPPPPEPPQPVTIKGLGVEIGFGGK